MNYDVNYFIKKFEAIPAKMWFVKWLVNDNGSKRCALGHCCPNFNKKCFTNGDGQTEESRALVSLFKIYNLGVGTINDGYCPQYEQPNPKKRILAALYDIKKMQQPEPT